MNPVGIPESIEAVLQLSLSEMHPTLEYIHNLVQKEIDYTKECIERHHGVAAYQSNCANWAQHLDAYAKVQALIDAALHARRARLDEMINAMTSAQETEPETESEMETAD